ncbi:MAG: hypothetical protein M1826_007581 [Phylliscum demangeonii]|nr:MAG: hypothetical protein M1826_007581 [Phylliscum demangeonii]
MDLSKKEYPELLERRKIEMMFAEELKKLAARQLPSGDSDLGSLAIPWHKIVHATDSIANAHQQLANRITMDVESPLRAFTTKNSEMQLLLSAQSNLATMAKEIESAIDKADKLRKKGGKASAGKVANAASDLEAATAQWNSQAPYVFENLQSVDETRLNLLRDVLTQFETHGVDQVERERVLAEECLNALLNLKLRAVNMGRAVPSQQLHQLLARMIREVNDLGHQPDQVAQDQRITSTPQLDPITQAELEAASESSQSPLKMDIRHAPIQEEEGDAQDAMASVANTLRISIRSSRSLTSLGATMAIKHAEMQGKGLNASVVETVSAWLEQGQVTKSVVIGEMALLYNPPDSSSVVESDTIKLENFHALEKVALNPAFVSSVPENSGEYYIKPSHIARTAVAFKYQVHLEDNHFSAHAPVILVASWKVEPTQTSVILHYSLNPTLNLADRKSYTLRNVAFVIHLDGARPSACQSKPVGTFSKERALIYWQFETLTLERGAAASKLLARFITDIEGKAGQIEARWEVTGDETTAIGSQLALSQSRSGGSSHHAAKETHDNPFADESGRPASGNALWSEVPLVRRIVCGTYVTT